MVYPFKFYKMARTHHALLRTGADVEHLEELDKKYWLVLSCPSKAPDYDDSVATVLDTDADGRVRVPEVLAGVAWLKGRLASYDVLFQPSDQLSVDDIATTEEGKVLTALLRKLAPQGALTFSSLDVALATFQTSLANGDGVVPITVVDEAVRPIAQAILTVTGGAQASDGSLGIAADNITAFNAAYETYLAWQQARPTVPLLDAGEVATIVSLVERLTSPIDRFFHDCALLRYNPSLREVLTTPSTATDSTDCAIALPAETLFELSFKQGIHPYWSAAMVQLQAIAQRLSAVETLDTLTAEVWEQMKVAVAPFVAWQQAQPKGAEVFATMDPQSQATIAKGTVQAVLTACIAEDSAQAPLAAAFADLRKLMVLRTRFLRFLRNYVNVEDLYPPVAHPSFLIGTLYLDGRACKLCFPIAQAAVAHATRAALSGCCLVYCTIQRPAEKLSRTLCAVFTAGSTGQLVVGKNGIFVDLSGKDWEATICHVVPNAMSLVEAFFMPWRKVGQAFSDTLHKFVASKDETLTGDMVLRSAALAGTVTTGKVAKPEVKSATTMTSVATMGIALSFIATAVTGVVAALTHTPLWKIAVAVMGIVVIVSIPSVILTWFKLRARDLAPILNASGWAVNRRIGLTAGLSKFFTSQAQFYGKGGGLRQHQWRLALIGLLVGLALVGSGWYFFCPKGPYQMRKAQVQVIAPSSVDDVNTIETNQVETLTTEKKEIE